MTVRTSDCPVTTGYSIVIPEGTVARAADYMEAVREGRLSPGGFQHDRLQGVDLRAMPGQDLLSTLFETKRPQIFAESAVVGDGSDWNLTELGLLGDVSIAVPVTIFDDGNHTLDQPMFDHE